MGLLLGAALLVLLAFNFLRFRAAVSSTNVEHQFATYRMGETLPQNMRGAFRMHYRVDGADGLSRALALALKSELEAKTSLGAATEVSGDADLLEAPMLYVQLERQRLWTPFFGRASVTAQVYYAYDGATPWPRDDVVHFDVSPAVKADGTFTLTDTSAGLFSRPAYDEYLAHALAQDIAAALQTDVFRSPS